MPPTFRDGLPSEASSSREDSSPSAAFFSRRSCIYHGTWVVLVQAYAPLVVLLRCFRDSLTFKRLIITVLSSLHYVKQRRDLEEALGDDARALARMTTSYLALGVSGHACRPLSRVFRRQISRASGRGRCLARNVVRFLSYIVVQYLACVLTILLLDESFGNSRLRKFSTASLFSLGEVELSHAEFGEGSV
jgi:hypothetical protein